MAQGKPDLAAGTITPLMQSAEATGRTGDVIELLALQALALDAQGQSIQAGTLIHRALTPAEPEGYVRLFVDEGRPMSALISRSLSREEEIPILRYSIRAAPPPRRGRRASSRFPKRWTPSW
jgi:LuxR family maltose regulon positive regulatory protein